VLLTSWVNARIAAYLFQGCGLSDRLEAEALLLFLGSNRPTVGFGQFGKTGSAGAPEQSAILAEGTIL
jgi:hypothetical protein